MDVKIIDEDGESILPIIQLIDVLSKRLQDGGLGLSDCADSPLMILRAQLCLMEDKMNDPKHYTSHPSGVECITITEHMNFNIGNAIKYLWRMDHKNKLEDLKKAAWYINREIQRLT